MSWAIRALRQDAMARDLAAELSEDETAWLDADAGRRRAWPPVELRQERGCGAIATVFTVPPGL